MVKGEFMAVDCHHSTADEVLIDLYVDFERAIKNEDGVIMHKLAERFDEFIFLRILHRSLDILEPNLNRQLW